MSQDCLTAYGGRKGGFGAVKCRCEGKGDPVHQDPMEESVRQRERETSKHSGSAPSAPVTPALENTGSASSRLQPVMPTSKAVIITNSPEVIKSFISACSNLRRLPRVMHVSLYAFHLQRSCQRFQPAGLFRAVLSHKVGGTVKLSLAAAQLPLL